MKNTAVVNDDRERDARITPPARRIDDKAVPRDERERGERKQSFAAEQQIDRQPPVVAARIQHERLGPVAPGFSGNSVQTSPVNAVGRMLPDTYTLNASCARRTARPRRCSEPPAQRRAPEQHGAGDREDDTGGVERVRQPEEQAREHVVRAFSGAAAQQVVTARERGGAARHVVGQDGRVRQRQRPQPRQRGHRGGDARAESEQPLERVRVAAAGRRTTRRR